MLEHCYNDLHLKDARAAMQQVPWIGDDPVEKTGQQDAQSASRRAAQGAARISLSFASNGAEQRDDANKTTL